MKRLVICALMACPFTAFVSDGVCQDSKLAQPEQLHLLISTPQGIARR